MYRSMIRSAVSAFLVGFVIAVPMLALAQIISAPPAPGAAAPTLEELLQQLLGTVSTWKAGGWIAGAIAVVNLASNLLKFKPLADLMEKAGIGWWMRPATSVVLGILAALFAKMAGGASTGVAVMIALVSGLASTGFHELLVAFLDNRVKAERAAGAKMVELLKAADTDAEVVASRLSTDLYAVLKTPGQAERLKALADWATKNPPPVVPQP